MPTHAHNTSAISRAELWTQSQGISCRADHIQLAAGSSSPSPIVIASHFNIAQRCAANALLTHQRAAANPHSSSEPRSYVTAVLGVGQTGAGRGQAWLKTLADILKNGFSISHFDELELSCQPVGRAWFPSPAWCSHLEVMRRVDLDHKICIAVFRLLQNPTFFP